MAQVWHYRQNGKQFGPVSEAELQQLVAAGKIKPTDMLWRDGMGVWIPVSAMKSLFPANPAPAASPPPPVPVKQANNQPAPIKGPPPITPTQKADGAAPWKAKIGSLWQQATTKAKEVWKLSSTRFAGLWQRSSKQARGGIVAGGAVAGLLVILLFCVLPMKWMFGGKGDASADRARNNPISQDELPLILSAGRLAKDYRFRQSDADAKYKGAMVQITGGPPIVSEDGLVLSFRRGSVELRCDFPNDAKADLKLAQGCQTVRLRGRCGGTSVSAQNGMVVSIHDCTFLLLKKRDGTTLKSVEVALAGNSNPRILTSHQLMQDYADDVTDANEKYQGKTLTMTGFVGNCDGKAVHVSAGTEFRPIHCAFGSEYHDQLRSMTAEFDSSGTKGDKAMLVTIKGVCAGSTGTGEQRYVRFDNCSLERTTPDRSLPPSLPEGFAKLVTARELATAYHTNEKAADEEYRDRKITVSGTIHDVRFKQILIEAGTDQRLVLCFFDCGEAEKLYALQYRSGGNGELRKGQQVRIVGLCSGLSHAINGIRLENCELPEQASEPPTK